VSRLGADDQIDAAKGSAAQQPSGCHTSSPWGNTIERNFPDRKRINRHDGSQVGMQCDHE